jgi:hypothetical protein
MTSIGEHMPARPVWPVTPVQGVRDVPLRTSIPQYLVLLVNPESAAESELYLMIDGLQGSHCRA